LHGLPRTRAAGTDEPTDGGAEADCVGLTFAAELSVHVPASARCPAGFPGRGGQGRAGAVVAGQAVRESVTLAGRAERARAARTFVSEVLCPGHPCGDVAVLLVSEIFGNSVRHSGSGAPGRRSRSRSGPGTALSGSRSPIAQGRGRRSCVLRAATRKAAGGFSSRRAGADVVRVRSGSA
jgi:hypothetical protein